MDLDELTNELFVDGQRLKAKAEDFASRYGRYDGSSHYAHITRNALMYLPLQPRRRYSAEELEIKVIARDAIETYLSLIDEFSDFRNVELSRPANAQSPARFFSELSSIGTGGCIAYILESENRLRGKANNIKALLDKMSKVYREAKVL